jgi:hypothetical protein
VTDVLATAQLLELGPDDGDWDEVRRRASRGRRRRGASVTLVLAGAVALVVASAYAFGHPIVDFRSAPKGPPKIVDDFGSLEVGAPAGMAPSVLPEEARRITSVRVDGKEHVLWVAPTKQGGFCEAWSQFVGGCRADRHDAFAKHIDVAGNQDVFAGSFFQESGSRLEVEYADGTSEEIPFVWVTEPIEAGFYLFRVPDAHRVDGHRPTKIRLLDDDGKLVVDDRIPFRQTGPPPSFVMHSLPGYPLLSVPAEALWSQREQLFDLRADDGERVGLWVAPERGGGTCYWFNQGTGCTHDNPRAIPQPRALVLGLSAAATHVALAGEVGRDIAKVEVRFEDGDQIELTPKRGYLLWPIPSRHYPVGTRLVELIGLDAQGQQIASLKMSSDQRGTYPCSKPKDYGYGVTMCP